MRRIVLLVAVAGLVPAGMGAAYAQPNSTPTCAGVGGIANHGEHVIGDYVTGLGGIGGGLGWPPDGGEVGATVGGNRGVVVRGGPGPGFHFQNDIPPGASFCIAQAQSPGSPPGRP